jgi:hypothetical protein
MLKTVSDIEKQQVNIIQVSGKSYSDFIAAFCVSSHNLSRLGGRVPPRFYFNPLLFSRASIEGSIPLNFI